MNFIKIYKIGFLVLLVAVLMNVVASYMGIATWYSFLQNPSFNIINLVFLFAVYPFVLGYSAYTFARR
ncbi:MAG: hypothetical protein ACMXYE_03680 [Candidatus Woesearchaeota archaeon]